MTVDAPESDQNGTTSDVRIAILSSDRGGHLQTLLEDPVVGQWVALVVADRPDAYAIRASPGWPTPVLALRRDMHQDIPGASTARVMIADHESPTPVREVRR